MIITFPKSLKCLCLLAAWVCIVHASIGQEILVSPSRGGGMGTNMPPMIHVDIFYDYSSNRMHATLDTNQGIPKLTPLPLGYAFDTRSNYSVLNGKAYNYQYAWNLGGLFTNPPGAAVWIERVSMSPGLENYDGPGNKTENPPRTWAPIFGTDGSPSIWKWYGRMAHNAYAILNPTTNILTARFRVYFGDAVSGSQAGYESYGDALVDLVWTVDPMPESPVLRFGVAEGVEGASVSFLNADRFGADSGRVLSLQATNSWYEGALRLETVLQSTNRPGSQLELQFLSLTGPAGGNFRFWEAGKAAPQCQFSVGQSAGDERCLIDTNSADYRAAVDRPGIYRLGFRVVDASLNGPDGGPIDASQIHYICFHAGVYLSSVKWQGTTVTVTFPGEPGRNFYLERSSSPDSSAQWEVVGVPILGFDRFQTLIDPLASTKQGFYRLRTSVP